MHILCLQSTYIRFMPGYKRSDDEAEDVQLSQPLDNPKEADPAPDLRPMAALQPQPPVLQLPPFDFDGIIRRSGGNSASLFRVIREVDALLPPGPIIVHSQRAGGGVRYLYFGVQRTTEIRSYFAYFTYFADITYLFLSLAWVDKCRSAIVYERHMWNRTELCWTLCMFLSPTTTRVTFAFTPPS